LQICVCLFQILLSARLAPACLDNIEQANVFEQVSEVQAALLDPNPIALWSVDRQSPLTLQPGRSGLQASLANGNVVKARIIAMLSGAALLHGQAGLGCAPASSRLTKGDRAS
jgi:hypothetical protein